MRHNLLAEPQGQLLGQRADRELLNSLKNDRVHGARYATHAKAAADLFDHIEPSYNRRRRHSVLGGASPVKFLEV